MITKHSADRANVKPFQIGLRLARVISIGNGTVDACPIGSSVVLHDIPVTSATTMEVGDVVNLQMMDNKRFAFASQNAVVSGESTSAGNITIQNGDIIIAGEGGAGAGTITGITAGNGLTGGGTAGAVTLNAGQGDGIVVDGNSIAVSSDVVRTSRSISTASGLTGGGDLSANRTLSINLAELSGLTIASGLAIRPATGGSAISVNSSGVFLASSLAGNGLSMTSQVLNVGAATTITDSVPASTGLQAEADVLRIYASSAPGAAQHVLASNSSGMLTLPLFLATTSVSTPSLISASGSLTVTSAGDTIFNPGSGFVKLSTNKSLQSDGYASQTTGMRITYSGEGDFRYIFTDELHAKSFIADLEQALAGGQIITKSVAVLFANYNLPAAGLSTSFTVQDLPSAKGMRVFEVGDFIGFRQFDRSGGGLLIGWAWGTVSNYQDNQDGTQSWTFTRSASPNAGIASGTINKDSIVLDFGESGNGYHEVNAIDGLQGANSPYSQIVTWSGHPRTRTVRTRLGNLRGIFGNSESSEYYLVIQNATGGTFLIQIDDERTGAIAYNATAAAVAIAINSIIAGATVSLVISGTTYTYTITIPSTYSYLPFSVNGKNVTGTAGLDFLCTIKTQTDSEFGLYAGKGTGTGDTYIRISDTTAEFRNTPIRLYAGSTETMRLWAGSTTGSGNIAPSFAMGSTLPTGPLTTSDGVWMGLSGAGLSGGATAYQFRVGSANGSVLENGILWNGSTLTVTGAINVVAGGNAETTSGAQTKANTAINAVVNTTTGKIAFNPTPAANAGLYLGSTNLGYYSGSAWKTYMDSSGNFYLDGSGTQGLTWTSSTSTLAIDGAITARSGDIAGVLTIGANGGIYQGNGTFSSPGTGLKIWSQLSGGAYYGRIGGYEAGVLQWYAGTDGKLYGGAGSVVIDDGGITVLSSGTNFLPQNAYRFSSAANQDSHIAVYTDASSYRSLRMYNTWTAGKAQIDLFVKSDASVSENAKLLLQSYSGNGSYSAVTRIISQQTGGGGGAGELNIYSPGGSRSSGEMNFTSYDDSSNSEVVFSADIDGMYVNTNFYANYLSAKNTRLMHYKYGPSSFNDPNTVPYLQYTVTSNTGGYPYGSFFINFAGRDGGSNATQELWYFQVYRNYLGAYVWSSQRIAGTENVFAKIVASTVGTSPNYTGTLTIRWWVGSVAATYNDGLEITVMELSSGLNAGHYGTFSVGSLNSIAGTTSPTSSQHGNMFAGKIVATERIEVPVIVTTEKIEVPVANNNDVFALDASQGSTTTLSANATYQPFSNANNFSGMVLVSNTTDRSVGLFLFGGNSVTLVSQSVAGKYSTNPNNADTINVYLSGSAVTVVNRFTTSRNVRVVGVRMETAI